jgi:excisionase family DNA binding protein
MFLMEDLLTVSEAAKELGVSNRRVHALIAAERLPARKLGSYYVIKRKDMDLVRERTVGRPAKSKST